MFGLSNLHETVDDEHYNTNLNFHSFYLLPKLRIDYVTFSGYIYLGDIYQNIWTNSTELKLRIY